ncbi:MAG: hypothetical protein FI702_01620 [SAR202 cluster bacterium]|nr:hypothetical protein [SAR202 cluster bacterium]
MNAGSPAIDTRTSIGAPVDDFENDSRPTNGDANGTLIHDMDADEAKSGKGTIEGKKLTTSMATANWIAASRAWRAGTFSTTPTIMAFVTAVQ